MRWYTYGFHSDGGYDAFIRYDLSDADDAERRLGGTMGFAWTPEESLQKAVVSVPEIIATAVLSAKDNDVPVLELRTLLDYAK